LPVVVAGAVIGFFLFRVLAPAREYMMRPELIMGMVFDAGMLVGVIAMRNRMPAWLFWTALLCGLGLFAIRFTSDAARWKGHLRYVLK
jgi:hypothetical protein